MKPSLILTFLSIVLCSIVHAEVPEKKPHEYYSGLWLNSPFTTKPTETDKGPVSTPFDDYYLTGIAPIEGGYRIVVSNKKDKDENVVIEPGKDSRFQVLAVDRAPGVRHGTTVTLTDGRFQGVVRFEPTLVVLNTAVNANPDSQLPPGVDPNQPNNASNPNNPKNFGNGQQVTEPNKPTRSRIVPPVKANTNNSNKNPQSRPSRIR